MIRQGTPRDRRLVLLPAVDAAAPPCAASLLADRHLARAYQSAEWAYEHCCNFARHTLRWQS